MREVQALLIILVTAWHTMSPALAEGPHFETDVTIKDNQGNNPHLGFWYNWDLPDAGAWFFIANRFNTGEFNLRNVVDGFGSDVAVFENGAPEHSLYVQSSGSIAMGTDVAFADLHIGNADGDSSASIRLSQDHPSAGAWDMRATDSSFQIKRASSFFPQLWIKNSSASNLLVAEEELLRLMSFVHLDRNAQAVGIGTDTPAASLHVLEDTGTAQIIVEETSPTVKKRTMTELANNGAPQLLFTDTAVATQWELNPNPSGNFIINSVGLGGGTEFTLNGSNGNLRVSGDIRAGDFIVTSTRESKTDFQAVDPRDVLQKVDQLPISQWRFKDDDKTQHMGPIAEDFKATFGLGKESTRISMIDTSGVALAAIQGLRREKDQQIEALKAEVSELKALVADLISDRE